MNQDILSKAITKGLAYTENGGVPDINNPVAGKTGETKSVFQFEPETWKAYSHQIFGKDVPMNADTEAYVVHQKVSKWVDDGFKEGLPPEIIAKQVASRWNAGPGEANAYTGKFSDGSPSVGINHKYGVKYDVPSYADKVAKYTHEFSQSGQSGSDQSPGQAQPVNEMKSQSPVKSSSSKSNKSTNSSKPKSPEMEKIFALVKKGSIPSGKSEGTKSKGDSLWNKVMSKKTA